MNPNDITYTYSTRGYMLYYKGKPIGGVGILPEAKGCRSNVKLYRDYAENEKRKILSGFVNEMFSSAMKKIDEEIKRENFFDKIREILETMYFDRDDHGYMHYEIYADYRDELDDMTAGEILLQEDPEQYLFEKLSDWYIDYECELRNEATTKVRKNISEDETICPDGELTDEMEEQIEEFMSEWVYFDLPEDHYLDQEFDVNIMIDTGDGNYDFTLNSVYPCWYGRYENRIDDNAGIVWLAHTQGYTKTQLWNALKEGDMEDPHGFLESMRVELANLPSHMSTVTFLTRMTFRELAKLNRAINWRDKQGVVYDARKYPYSGYIVLDKDTMCGLFDPWSGGGSVLEVSLEKDVRLPIKYIRSALPDEGHLPHEYSLGSVYGMRGSAWKETVKEIHIPKKI